MFEKNLSYPRDSNRLPGVSVSNMNNFTNIRKKSSFSLDMPIWTRSYLMKKSRDTVPSRGCTMLWHYELYVYNTDTVGYMPILTGYVFADTGLYADAVGYILTYWHSGLYVYTVGYMLTHWAICWHCGLNTDTVGYMLTLWAICWHCGLNTDTVGYMLTLWAIYRHCRQDADTFFGLHADTVGYMLTLWAIYYIVPDTPGSLFS